MKFVTCIETLDGRTVASLHPLCNMVIKFFPHDNKVILRFPPDTSIREYGNNVWTVMREFLSDPSSTEMVIKKVNWEVEVYIKRGNMK